MQCDTLHLSLDSIQPGMNCSSLLSTLCPSLISREHIYKDKCDYHRSCKSTWPIDVTVIIQWVTSVLLECQKCSISHVWIDIRRSTRITSHQSCFTTSLNGRCQKSRGLVTWLSVLIAMAWGPTVNTSEEGTLDPSYGSHIKLSVPNGPGPINIISDWLQLHQVPAIPLL